MPHVYGESTRVDRRCTSAASVLTFSIILIIGSQNGENTSALLSDYATITGSDTASDDDLIALYKGNILAHVILSINFVSYSHLSLSFMFLFLLWIHTLFASICQKIGLVGGRHERRNDGSGIESNLRSCCSSTRKESNWMSIGIHCEAES